MDNIYKPTKEYSFIHISPNVWKECYFLSYKIKQKKRCHHVLRMDWGVLIFFILCWILGKKKE